MTDNEDGQGKVEYIQSFKDAMFFMMNYKKISNLPNTGLFLGHTSSQKGERGPKHKTG